ncbi:relaxase MobL [Spiroplasma endosymbiont of Cantharis lateralis]|uniref:relaxase MobL n=1 Tax=Spiroplasma endosymbiont of Cantharis lateralis TaxID=3066277 RepID=UPI00313BAA5B
MYKEAKTINEETLELNTPVIFKIKEFAKFGKTKDERKKRIEYYYSGRAQLEGKINNRTYLDYITRKDANIKFDLTREEIIELNKLKKNDFKSYLKKLEEYKIIKKQSSGIWSKDGIVDDERLKEIKNNLLKIDGDKQFIWDTVISFSDIFCEKYNIYNSETIYNTLKERIDMLFWSKNVNPDKMEWFFSFHSNTDNPHVHLLFFEKESTRINSSYQNVYNFDKELLEEFRFKFARDMILKEKNIELKEFTKSRENLVEFFKKSLREPFIFNKTTWQDVKEIYNDLSNNYEKILQEINQYNRNNNKDNFRKVNKLTYNLLSKTRRDSINKLINHILKNDTNINKQYMSYLKNLGIYEDVVNEVNGNKESNFKNESLYGKDGLYSRIGNKILYAIKRNIDVSNKGIFMPRYYGKIKKIKISIISNLMSQVESIIFATNKFLKSEIENTKQILETRDR